jgi:small-conductance mechanosensitive channel
MQHFGKFVTGHSDLRNFASDFFARTPFHSFYFIAGTVVMAIDLAAVGMVLARFWNRMPMIAMLQVGFAVVAMFALWWRAYLTCQRLHEVYSQAKSDPGFTRSPLDTALRNAAAVTGGSLYFSFFMASWLLLALASALRSH